MYRHFGSAVTIIETGARLMQREDEDVSAAIKDILEQEGVNVRLHAAGRAASQSRAIVLPQAEPAWRNPWRHPA
jgi:pyruvate/2-oxoglutarate dehydrogenase complex dihydrolipoamide dehydrogenase (E3) component